MTLPDGRQIKKRLAPAWTQRSRPPAGYMTKRMAEDWLADLLGDARRGTLTGMVRSGVSFAEAAEEYLRYIAEDRGRMASTVKGYRWIVCGQLVPAFGQRQIEHITTDEIEAWAGTLGGTPSSRRKTLILLNGIFKRARRLSKLPSNPAALVEKPPLQRSGDIAVFGPEEVHALVRAAESEQEAALYLTAAFTGLRQGELADLRWREVDFASSTIRVRASYSLGALTTPKSGKVRSVPMAPEVAGALARLGQRERWTAEDDLVFPGVLGSYLDASAVRKHYGAALDRAGLRRLRFHDLRHTFGTRMIGVADIRRVQEWMGHADVQTTMQYLHYVPRAEDAALVARAFRPSLSPESFIGGRGS